MNISELARKLKITTQELKEKLPELGFDIGQKAIQIPDEQANRVIKSWQEYKNQEENKKRLGKIQERLEVKKETAIENGLVLPASISVHDLASKIKVSVPKLIQQLMNNGILATINESLDFEIAAIVLEQFGYKAKKENVEEKEKQVDEINKEKLQNLISQHQENKSNLKIKPPVVVVMGHIDHGKTSLLDHIRQTQIAAKEAGAITQHIGAYQVEKKGKKITFIDTPGHEAFKVMRGRGGQVADLAILVVAADDGVKDQTIESLKIIQKEELPFIVAVNKIDKSGANPEKVKKELAELNVTPEDWGGNIICHLISAKTGEGIKELLDLILLMAEMEKEHLMADYSKLAIGTIIESHLDKGEGPVATAIIHSGKLKKEDNILVGQAYGRVRILKNWRGESLSEADPGMPVKIVGLKNLPKVGDILEVKSEKDLKDLKKNLKTKKYLKTGETQRIKEEEENKKSLDLIIKADVSGSLEAILEMIKKTAIPEVKIKIIKSGLGPITEIDVVVAEKSKGLIFGFNVDLTTEAKKCALEKGVKSFTSKIIYEIIDQIKKEIKEVKGKITKEIGLGKFKILAVFNKTPEYSIIGGKVLEGKVLIKSKVRVWREKSLIAEGEINGLQLNKTDVNEVTAGNECGLKYKGIEEIKIGDVFEIYKEEKV